jgi:hypothetical protein
VSTSSSKRKLNKSSLAWKKKFFPKLKQCHGTHAKKIFHRLMNKSSSLRSTLKRRSKDYEVEFEITLIEIRNMLYDSYGKTCRYCANRLDVTNMVCDHIQPISSGGPSVPENLQMICKRCNTRKGPLSHDSYKKLIVWLEKQSRDTRNYILRKLASKDVMNG